MNSSTVLQKILTLLKKEEEVKLTYAKLKDGTIVESPTFDVGEPVEIVSEDGTKSPAPDGEHELALRDTEGNEVLIKVITEGGKIVERENVELAAKDLETKDVEPLPNTTDEPKANKVEEMQEESPEDVMEDPSEEDKEIEINLGDLSKKLEEMAYRIDELEKVLKAQAEEKKEEVKEEIKEEVMEEELPKLDGAPIEKETGVKFSAIGKQSKGAGYQSSFLKKLYN